MDYKLSVGKNTKGDGEDSEWAEVTSGIPQGSVIGPLLFVIFINDLPDLVSSTVYLFADDTKIFNVISSDEDRTTLQDDLHKLDERSKTWLLRFHPQVIHRYKLGDQLLESQQRKKTYVLLWTRT